MITVGLVGYGTVGQGVADIIAHRCLDHITIATVVVRDPTKARDVAPPARISTHLSDVITDPSIDVVVEVAGTPAVFLDQALEAGKHVVTANKAALSSHYEQLLTKASQKNLMLGFEASVAGGIPIIETILRQRQHNSITSITGIINGATNHILSQLSSQEMTYEQAIEDAYHQGFLEADPSDDLEASDACRKLRILATLAFDRNLQEHQIPCRGITAIRQSDIAVLAEQDLVIKLLASAVLEDAPVGQEKVTAFVGPTAVPSHHPLSMINGATNSVSFAATNLGETTLIGPGAGRYPTANSVLSDLIALGNDQYCTPGPPAVGFTPCTAPRSRYYVRGAQLRASSVEQRCGAGVLTKPIAWSELQSLPPHVCIVRILS